MEKLEKVIGKYKMNNCIHDNGYRNNPLTEELKQGNREKSKTIAILEHALNFLNIGCTSIKLKQVLLYVRFGQYLDFMKQRINGLSLKSVGIARAIVMIELANLTYNLFRYEQIIFLNI